MIHKENGYLIYNTKNYGIFHEAANADDIIQGTLGDCYFLSVRGSLCNNINQIIILLTIKELKKKKNYIEIKKI